jgi:hypothetical protein
LAAASTLKAGAANRWCPLHAALAGIPVGAGRTLQIRQRTQGHPGPAPKPTGVEAGGEIHAANEAELSLVPCTFRVGDGHLDQAARLRANTAHGRGAQLYP